MTDMQSDYPVRLEVDYPEQSSRALAFCGIFWFIKPLLLLPHLIVLGLFGLVAAILMWVTFWIVLVTGKYPRGIFDLVLGFHRWQIRTNCWVAGLTDRYPPFSLT